MLEPIGKLLRVRHSIALFALLWAHQCIAQLFPLTLQWDYSSNALFQLDWQYGFLLTTSKTAVAYVPAGTNTFIVAATVNGIQSLPSVPLTALVVKAELQFSTNLANWQTVDTNRFVITNFPNAGFYRSKVFLP